MATLFNVYVYNCAKWKLLKGQQFATDLNRDRFNIRLSIFTIVHTIKYTPGTINKIVP